jgi:hypothetical protein
MFCSLRCLCPLEFLNRGESFDADLTNLTFFDQVPIVF